MLNWRRSASPILAVAACIAISRCSTPAAVASAGTAAAAAASVVPPLPARRILLVRHGESVFNRDGRFQGSLRGVMKGPKLTRLGCKQAKQLGRALRELCGGPHGLGGESVRVRVSPLRRARQTWRRIRRRAGLRRAARRTAEAWGELREIDLFEWEGRTKEEIAGKFPEQWQRWVSEPWKLRLASGIRPVRLLLARAVGVWARLGMETPPGGTTLVIAHGALNKAILMEALVLPAEAYCDPLLQFGNCAAAELEIPGSEGDEDQEGEDSDFEVPKATRWRWLYRANSDAKTAREPWEWRDAAEERKRYQQGLADGSTIPETA
eukprot:TRINITY_DN98572_c0_g1_i1.p1 TRINITY_DN98572_c0_g1~~TRINITY_DN98572_c0_g1_i1.p1  ORF type:complete len:358 (+),score=56.84 TRINITY_DN98572_c0_g1_i1:106-1074(+)